MNDHATKSDIKRLEGEIEVLKAMLDEALVLLRGQSAIVPQSPLTKRPVDPDFLPGGKYWRLNASEEERKEYNRNILKERRARRNGS